MQHRFKNMKDTFMTNLRKVKESKRSGVSTDSIYVPKWHLFKELQFLEKACAQAKSTSYIETMSSGGCAKASPLTTPLEKDMQTCSSGNVETVTTQYYYDDNLSQVLMIPIDTESSGTENCDMSSPSELGSMSNPGSPDVFVPPRPASAPSATVNTFKNPSSGSRKRGLEPNGDEMIQKKGYGQRNSNALMAQAIETFKEIARQSPPEMPAMPVPDPIGTFCAFVGSRLHSMTPAQRKLTEDRILQALMSPFN